MYRRRAGRLDLDADPADGRASFEERVESRRLLEGDVSDRAVVDEAVRVATEEGGDDPTVAVNCAGVGSGGRFEEITVEDLRRTFRVHVEGTFNGCRAVLPGMDDAGGGAIVNTGSIAALVGWRATADYTPAKGAVEAMTRQLAAEASPKGVRVPLTARRDNRRATGERLRGPRWQPTRPRPRTAGRRPAAPRAGRRRSAPPVRTRPGGP